jgi:hypothetical protein
MRAAKGRERRNRKDSGAAESGMPQREPINDMKADVIEIDLSERPPEPGRDECHAWAGDVIGALPGE